MPLRLRGLTVLAAALAAAPVIAWAFGQDALSKNAAALPARVTAGHHLGVLLVLMAALLLAAGLAIGFAVARRAPSPRCAAGGRHRGGGGSRSRRSSWSSCSRSPRAAWAGA